MLASSLFLLPLFSTTVLALNDWSVPCFQGTCEYESGDGVTSAWGSIQINGPTNRISDITRAAGWEILGCDPNSAARQAIRLVCRSEDQEAAGCSHVFEGGTLNTIIRLPDSCGAGPFARVARWGVSEDQRLPASVRRLFKRQDAIPPVQSVDFDFDFSKIPPDAGEVTLSASATNIPGEEQKFDSPLLRRALRRRGRLHRRGFISDFIDRLKNLNTIEERFNKDLPPIDVKQNFPILDQSVSCPATNTTPAFNAGLNINVDTALNAQISYGYVFTGSIVPPKIDDLAFYSSLAATAAATFNIHATAQATVDSGRIPIFQVGLPGLSFPGIITIGPSFSINGQALATLGVSGDVSVGAKWNMPRVELVFPPKQGDSLANADPNETPLKLSLDPSIAVNGAAEVHLIPRVDLGVNILNGIGKASIFLDLDVSGKLDMSLKAKANVNLETEAAGRVDGCVGLEAGVALRAGAQGALEPFFNQETSVNLFEKKAKLFEKCFGTGSLTRRMNMLELDSALHKRQLELLCPAVVGALATLIDQNVSAI